ncbi:type I-E CRISPR-associated protein Cse1/CasA [Isoptericola sp. BMS4]|uniref:type I-E CRISPR-associated protein Cse1/CasA n=1 Tax=Isoptericola sp. BMS4 TaxID=2527875 RepID=UPI00141F9FF9|nr:type I-E CRISPR-associated protein Cse1/CasA [Isoptericola sp. BMS4]
MDEPRFSLVDEPWIPVLDNGVVVELSLRDVFRRSHEVGQIACELPTQSFAVLRMVLAVLHRGANGPLSVDEWVEIRDEWTTMVADVDAYLDDWHDRFWLQHPVHPFMQVPDLRTAKDEVFGLSRIICDGRHDSAAEAFLSTRVGNDLETASLAEAARWLVHAHAYDVSGIHTGAVGDRRVKGGKGYGIGTGWAGQIGGLYAVGDTLRETLLLNLVAPTPAGLTPSGDDRPVWERAPLGPEPEDWDGVHDRQPTGPVDLYTWQARRIRLIGDGDKIIGCINAQGDRATPYNRYRFEPMTAWRYSEPQTRRFRAETYMPLKHQPDRALWRGLPALLVHDQDGVPRGEPARRRPPGVVRWIEELENQQRIGQGLVRLGSVGLEYGSNESVYEQMLADELDLPVDLFDPGRRDLADAATAAVSVADAAARALGAFAQNVALAAGGSTESDSPDTSARERAYARLDKVFRAWVATLRRGSDPAERRVAWQRAVYAVVRGVADDVVDTAGPAALVGRVAGGHFRDVGVAERWLGRRLREALPHAFEGDDGDDAEEAA